jgi:hypothetical protein
VVNGFLPTKGVLHRRHVEPLPNCDTCGADEETIKHALLECTVARVFWEQVKVLTGVKVPALHPLTWAQGLVDPGLIAAKDAAIILCGMWSIWMSRNKRRHEVGILVGIAARWAIDTAFDLWQLSHPIKNTGNLVRRQQCWRPPE